MESAFSKRLNGLEAARVPFRQALLERLGEAGEADLLIFTPENQNAKMNTPASVLAIWSNGWLLIVETPAGGTTTVEADFAHTLSLELTGILLYGQLSITYAQDAALKHAVIVFNTVKIDIYSEATERILRGTRGLSGSAGRHTREDGPGVEKLPFKFRSALYDSTPPGEHVQALLSWPMVVSQAHHFEEQHELANAGILVLTEHTLLIIREELSKGYFWIKNRPHYGKITAFIPLLRLRGHSLRYVEDSSLMQISLHLVADEKAESTVDVDLPMSLEADAVVFLEKLETVVQTSGDKPRSTSGSHTHSEPGIRAGS